LKASGGHTDRAEMKGLHLMEVVREAVVLGHQRGSGVSSVCRQCHVLWLSIPWRRPRVQENTRIWLAQFC